MSVSPTSLPSLQSPAERLAEERLLRAIADQSRDIIIVVTAAGVIRYANRHLERVLGYAVERLLGQVVFDYLHAEDAVSLRELLALLTQDASRSGRFPAEYRLRHADGSWRWFEVMSSNLLDDPDVKGLLVNIRDVTDRKQAQIQLAQAEAALRDSELRYRTVAEFTPGFVQEWCLHPNGDRRLIWVSAGFEKVYGVDLAEYHARGGWAAFTRSEEHYKVLERQAQLLRGEQTEGELRIVDAQGHERFLLTINRPVARAHDGTITTIGVVYDITKRKRVEIELIAANARRAAIQEVALDCIIVMNHEGRMLEFNPAAERTFGYAREQVIGELLHEKIIPARYRAQHALGLARYLATGQSKMFGKRIELSGMRANGEEFPLELEIAPVFLDENPVFTAYLRDITERKRIEQRLSASESLRRAVTDNAPDWLMMLDLQLRVQFANRAVRGVQPHELIGRDALEFLPESEREGARQVFRRVVEGRAPHVYEFRETRHGEVRWFENRVAPVIEGGVTVGLTVASSEITGRRRNEEALRTQARILDTMREGVVVLDSNRVIRVVNSAMARLTGYQPRELLGRHGSMLSNRSAADYALADAETVRRLRSEGFCELEFECVRRNGSTFMAAVVLTPLELGGEEHILCVVEDITQRRMLEREIIEIANREQRRIGSDLHDGLGQELTGIALMLRGLTARLTREGAAAAPDAEEIVQLVNKAIESTRQLARGLSPVSIERGGLPFALRALATRATDLYGCSVRFRSKVWPQLTLDASASNHLYRIAQEAITNAVRHGHATEVTVDLQALGVDVKLSVADNGRGLEPGVELAQGMGLRIMRYRAHIVGGSVEILPGESGVGVRVIVSCRQPALGDNPPQRVVP